MTNSPPILLTARQAGQIVHLNERAIYYLINQRKLPAVRLGRHVRVRVSDLATAIGMSAEDLRQAAAALFGDRAKAAA